MGEGGIHSYIAIREWAWLICLNFATALREGREGTEEEIRSHGVGTGLEAGGASAVTADSSDCR